MAASPDIISGLLSDPNTAPYLGAAMGLLGSSGASRLPVTMGAAMGNALGGSQQYTSQALQNALRSALLPLQQMKTAEAIKYIRSLNGQPSQDLSTLNQGQPIAPNATQKQLSNLNTANNDGNYPAAQALITGGLGQLTPYSSPMPPYSPSAGQTQNLPQTPSTSQRPLSAEDALLQDPNYREAQVGAFLGFGGATQKMQQIADAHFKYAPQRPLTPQETASYFPGGLTPGFSAWQNTATGAVTIRGENPYKSISGYNAQGLPITTLVDTRGHTVTVPSNMVPGQGIGTPGAAPSLPPIVPGGNISSPVPPSIGTDMDKMARGIANYSIKPSSYMLRSPAGQIIMGKVMQYNPNYDQKQYEIAQDTLKDFSTGTQGLAVKSFNVALQHLDVLDKLSQGLKNHDTRSMNSLVNMAKKQFGKSAPTAFDAAKQLVADEIQKAVAGVPGGESERSQLMDNISSASSPEQLQGVINTFEKLMVGQLSGLQREYESGTQRNDFSNRYLMPASKKLFSKYENQTSGAQSVNQAPPAAVAYLKAHPELRQQFQNKYGYLPE